LTIRRSRSRAQAVRAGPGGGLPCPQLRPLRAVSGSFGPADRQRGQVPSCRGHRRSRPPINCWPGLVVHRFGERQPLGWSLACPLRAATCANAAVMPQILPSLLRFAAAAAVVSDQTAGLRPGGLSAGAVAPDACPSCPRVSAVDSPAGRLPVIPGNLPDACTGWWSTQPARFGQPW